MIIDLVVCRTLVDEYVLNSVSPQVYTQMTIICKKADLGLITP